MQNRLQNTDIMSTTIAQFNSVHNSEHNNSTDNNKTQAIITPITPTSKTTRTRSSSSSVHTEPGVSSENDLNRLKISYCRLLGDITANVGWYLSDLIDEGMEIDVIIHAIEETSWARHPSPRYLRCILERYRADEIYTMDDLRRDMRDREIDKAASRAEREWWM